MSTREPTWEEIQRWRERLENREFQRFLLGFQAYVYQLFEDLRKQTGLALIRATICRDEIKSLDSLVEKISRKREEQDPKDEPYDFDDIKDFVGIKILCPYLENAHEVADWLFRQTNRVRVLESCKEKGRRQDSSGYKGYNFTVYPPVGAPAAWGTAYCEMQIKTIIEEAWDAKTHDLSHKIRKAIPKKYQTRYKDLSDLLTTVERQGEAIRQDIEEILEEAKSHREVAAKELLAYAIEHLNSLRNTYPKIPTIEIGRTYEAHALVEINEALRSEWASGRLTKDLCFDAAFVALSQEDLGQAAFALQLVNDLVMKNPEAPDIELARASIYWSLSRFSRAVEFCERVLEKCDKVQSDQLSEARWKADCCYYITDATLFFTYVPSEVLERVQKLAEEIFRGPGKNEVSIMDTTGFVKIVLGSTKREVENGIRRVEAAIKLAKATKNSRLIQLAEAFCSRHVRLGKRRLEHFS